MIGVAVAHIVVISRKARRKMQRVLAGAGGNLQNRAMSIEDELLELFQDRLLVSLRGGPHGQTKLVLCVHVRCSPATLVHLVLARGRGATAPLQVPDSAAKCAPRPKFQRQ